MARSPCSSNEEGLNRGNWTAQEDIILSEYIRIHGVGRWKTLPRNAGLKRCGKSCRLRWLNYLRPEIIRGSISLDEEELIIRMHRLLGNRWSLIAGRLPGRTDNEIKNYWNTNLKKKLHSKKQSESKTMSKSPSPLQQNHVIKSRPVRITTAVKHCEMVSLNGCNGFDRSSPKSSNHASEFSTVEEITNSSKSWCNLVVMDSIAEDHPEPIAFMNLRDVNLVETETRNAILGDPQSPVHCENFAGNAATLAESLCDLNQLSSPHCNLLSSPSSFLTNLGLEELYTGAKTEECEAVCCDESNMPHINSSTFADPHGGVEIYDTIYHVDWIHEHDYIWS